MRIRKCKNIISSRFPSFRQGLAQDTALLIIFGSLLSPKMTSLYGIAEEHLCQKIKDDLHEISKTTKQKPQSKPH